MVKRGHLDVPVIGVAKAGWDLDQLRARARDSLEQHGGGVDAAAFDKLASLLRYVDGDYDDPAPSTQLRRALGRRERPLHYLAIPPSLFATVVDAARPLRLRERRTRRRRRSRSAATSLPRRRSTARCSRCSPSRRSSASTTTSARSRCRTCSTSASPTRSSSRSGTATTSTACRSRWPRASASRAAAASTRRRARSATSSQNHLLQVTACLAMDAPSSGQRRRHARREGAPARGDRAARSDGRRARAVPRLPRRARRRARLARSRRSRRCGSTSTTGAGPACPSTSAPASACR